MSSILPADSTVVAIRKKVRRLTASADEASLSTPDLDQYINTFYSQDFPYGVKTDQMRSVYEFYTIPYIDRYPLDIYYNQGVRAPFYVDGLLGNFTKDRQEFFKVWPKLPDTFRPASGNGSNQIFPFTIPGPFLRNEVIIGVTATSGAFISISDDGNGGLWYRAPNAVTAVPPINSNPGIPGMHNINTGNPGLYNSINVGTVNYVTGVFNINLTPTTLIPAAGEQLIVRVSQYQPGRPYSMMLWNNEFTIRPVPKEIHKCTVETYLTPVQFMEQTDVPIVNQWWQCIAIGAAIKILQDRQDMEGMENLGVMYAEQRDLVLERQATEEIFQPNYTLFNSAYQAYGSINGCGYW